MTFSSKDKISSNRSFGLVFFLVFFVIAFWSFRGDFNQIRVLPLSISLIFLILGMLNSKLLTPLNKIWIRFGFLIGSIVAPIIMGAIFFFVVTPIGILVRLFGKDLLKLKTNKNTNSYWIKRNEEKTSMKKQF
tara:strand:- start:1841 stop:2239 length:399 start_codon:yes stop_codon:yes gene_type:complete